MCRAGVGAEGLQQFTVVGATFFEVLGPGGIWGYQGLQRPCSKAFCGPSVIRKGQITIIVLNAAIV